MIGALVFRVQPQRSGETMDALRATLGNSAAKKKSVFNNMFSNFGGRSKPADAEGAVASTTKPERAVEKPPIEVPAVAATRKTPTPPQDSEHEKLEGWSGSQDDTPAAAVKPGDVPAKAVSLADAPLVPVKPAAPPPSKTIKPSTTSLLRTVDAVMKPVVAPGSVQSARASPPLLPAASPSVLDKDGGTASIVSSAVQGVHKLPPAQQSAKQSIITDPSVVSVSDLGVDLVPVPTLTSIIRQVDCGLK